MREYEPVPGFRALGLRESWASSNTSCTRARKTQPHWHLKAEAEAQTAPAESEEAIQRKRGGQASTCCKGGKYLRCEFSAGQEPKDSRLSMSDVGFQLGLRELQGP